MVPRLEALEDRCAPSSFFFTETRAPANVTNLYAAMADTALLLFAGQFPALHLGIPSQGSQQIIRYDVTPEQWAGIIGGPPSTGRWVASVAGGFVPIVFVCDGVNPQPGLTWETTCFANGWALEDPPDVTSVVAIPPGGPQASLNFGGVNFLPADALVLSGNPLWFLLL